MKFLEKLPKFNPEMKLLSPQNRGFLLVASITVLIVGVTIAFLLFDSEDEKSSMVALDSVKETDVVVTADAQVSEEYGKSIKQINKKAYDSAKRKDDGAVMPILYHSKDSNTASKGDIDSCGCTFDDNAREQLIAELERLGIKGIKKTDALRVGRSDIYIRGDGSIVDENDTPYLFNGDEIATDSSGALINKRTGMGFKSLNGDMIYLGNEGQIYDQNTSVISLKGRILSGSGVILLGNGSLAYRPGGIKQVGNSDVYISQDEQLATMDGKPVLHSGNFVFKDAENRLRNALNEEVYWNSQFVIQSDQGTLTDKRNVKFKKAGILFSYDGILIDNDSMLTGELDNISRFGDSDLFMSSDHQIVDGYNQPVTYLGYTLTLGTNNVIHSQIGMLTRNGSPVTLKETGRLNTQQGVVLTGTLKNSESVAYDKHGHLLSRQGKLSRLGISDIYISSDRFLADTNGKAITFNDKDTFQDLGRYKVLNGVDAFGLVTFDDEIIKDLAGNEVYLTVLGELVDETGVEIKQSGILKNADNVLINSSGELLVKKGSKSVVTDKAGNPVLYNGKRVFKGPDNRLYTEDGTPVLDSKGQAVFVSDSGVLTDEFGNIINEDLLVSGSRDIDAGEVLSIQEPLLDIYGNPLTFQGKKAFVKNGMLTDEEGNLILDDSGNPIRVTEDNELVSINGDPITEKLKNIDGTEVTGKIKRGAATLTTAKGNVIKFKGEDVQLDEQGFLVDSKGNRILDANGSPLRLNESGQIVDINGVETTVDGLTVNGESKAENGGFATLDSFKDSDGNEVFFNGEKVYKKPDGSLVLADGTPVLNENNEPVFFDGAYFTDSLGTVITPPEFSLDDGSGLVTTKDGAPLMYKGKKVYKNADGTITDEFGSPILGNDGKPLSINDKGEIVDSSGKKADVSEFTAGGKAIKNSGLSIQPKSEFDMVLGADNKPLLYKGKPVYKDKDGNLRDASGNLIVDDMGIPLALNENGEIVTPDGELAPMTDFSQKENTGFTAVSATAAELVTSKDGSPLMYNGERVFKRADGTMVTESGKVLKGADNKPLKMGDDGVIRTSSGKKASMKGFKASGKQPINSGFVTKGKGKADIVLGKDGTPLLYKGKKVFKRPDGTLVTESGEVIRSKSGEPLKLDASGTIRTRTGSKADMEGFTTTGEAVKNGELKSLAQGALKTLGKSGVALTEDGLLVDASGKAIKYKNKNVRRSASGQLFNEHGRPLLTPEGKTIYMNDEGQIVDKNGNPLPDVLLQNGDGQILGDEDSKTDLKRVGKSDLYVTRDGIVTDAFSKPMLYKGKPVKVGEGGRLYTIDGVPVTDAAGNSVYMTGSGELKNKQRQLVKGAILETSDAVQVDSKGLLVTNGGKLTSIGNGLYKTADNLIVDRDGRVVKVDGKPAFINEDNQIVDFYSRPIRFKGRQLTLQADGTLTDEQGNPISDGDEGVLLTPKGIVDASGKLIDLPEEKQNTDIKPSSKIIDMVDNSQVEEIQEPVVTEAQTVVKTPVINSDSEEEPRLKVEDLTTAETQRLNERYARIKQNILAKLAGHTPTMRQRITSTDIALNGETALPNSEVEQAQGEVSIQPVKPQPTAKKAELNHTGQRVRAGSTLYAVNTMRVNTDLNTNIIFKVMGVPHDHFLYHATVGGKISLKYDYIVMEFNNICPMKGECIPINAIGVNPATKQANIEGEIDKHYWYRFGGLAMSTLIQGAAQAVGESQERTEEIDPITGKTITYSGLDGEKLLIRATEKTGEAFASVFMENVNRPATGIVEKDEEIAIFFFEDVLEPTLEPEFGE